MGYYIPPSTYSVVVVRPQQVQSTTFETASATTLAADVQAAIAQNEAQGVTTSVLITDPTTGAVIVDHNTDTEHFAASVNKVPISQVIVDKLRAGTITLDTTITWQRSDVRAGAGVYDSKGAKTRATVRDLLKDTLNRSGNTAPRALVNYVMGGAYVVNDIWRNTYGLQHTYLQPLTADGKTFYFGNSNAKEAMRMLEQLTSVQDSYGQLVTEYMRTNTWTQMGVRSQLQGRTYLDLVNKIGSLDDPEGNNRHDVGILTNKNTGKVYHYSMLTTSPYGNSSATTRADTSLKQIGTLMINETNAVTTAAATITSGTTSKPKFATIRL